MCSFSFQERKGRVTASSVSNVPTSKQGGLERGIHEFKGLADVTIPAPESKYSATDEDHVTAPAGFGREDEIYTTKNDSSQINQGSDVKNNSLEVQSDEEILPRNNGKHELKQMEAVMINTSQNTLYEKQQPGTRVREEFSQARIAFGELEVRLRNELARSRQSLDREIRLRNTIEQELKEKEMILGELQKTLTEEQQARAKVGEELKQARSACSEREGRLQNELAQIRQTLDNEVRLRNTREQELKEKRTVVDELQKRLSEKQRARTRVEQELRHELQVKENAIREQQRYLEDERQQKTVLGERLRSLQLQIEEKNRIEGELRNELARVRQTLDRGVQLRNAREQELREREKVVDELQKTLDEEQQARTMVEQELRQELQVKENAVTEQQRNLEDERQQKTVVEERLRNLQLQIEEENNRHVSTERELESALSAAQEALAEYQRRQPRDWIIQREEVLMSDNVLGRGAWGIVREGTFRSCQVAVKEIHELILSPHNRRLFEREMSIASCCRHPNLLQFIGATNDNGSPLFVTELLDTSLRRLLSQGALNHKEIINLALDIAKGLNYLHLNKPLPIIHRDISSANVLLWRRDECWRAKLSDYGSANFLRQVMTVNQGAVIYSAPEASTSQQSPKVKTSVFYKFQQ